MESMSKAEFLKWPLMAVTIPVLLVLFVLSLPYALFEDRSYLDRLNHGWSDWNTE